MADSYFQAKDGRAVLMKDGKVVFDSDASRKSIQLAPASKAISKTITVDFPDFDKDNAYHYEGGEDNLGPGHQISSCESYATIVPQEWGPSASGSKKLSDSTIGSVPAATDYLDVQINLKRSRNPSKWLGSDLTTMLPTNQWIQLVGGSCVVEVYGPMRRMFEIVRSGTSVILRRYQSVMSATTVDWNTGNKVYSSQTGGKLDGWTYGGNPKGFLASQIEAKGTSGNVNKERGGSNACSLDDKTNYRSTYSVQVRITPGKYGS